jgi:hypothetical protein
MFGKRMAQPVVAIPLAAAAIDLPGVLVARLAGPPHLDGGALVLEGGLGRQRFVWRLFVRDPPALLAAIARPVEALTAAALKTPP